MKKLAAFALFFSPVALSIIGLHFYGYPGLAAGMVGVLLIYAGIKAGKLPLVEKGKIKGANGLNRPLHVIIDPTVPYYKAVLAQEVWESIHKTNPINLFKSRSKRGQRELELMGHEVEVQAAVLLYGVNEKEYRAKEAKSMTGYKQFKGFSARSIERDMTKRTQAARKWLNRRSIL